MPKLISKNFVKPEYRPCFWSLPLANGGKILFVLFIFPSSSETRKPKNSQGEMFSTDVCLITEGSLQPGDQSVGQPGEQRSTLTWGIGQMLLILIHHITTAPDIDTDTYLSSVRYACFERLPEMIINNPIRMGHGAIINGHGGPG